MLMYKFIQFTIATHRCALSKDPLCLPLYEASKLHCTELPLLWRCLWISQILLCHFTPSYPQCTSLILCCTPNYPAFNGDCSHHVTTITFKQLTMNCHWFPRFVFAPVCFSSSSRVNKKRDCLNIWFNGFIKDILRVR